jgi:proteasome accessory factor C
VSNPVPRLRRLLSIIPLIRRREGISIQELQSTLGVSKRELHGDLNAIMLCGVPPYLPNDYISVFIDGDHVTVDYADHFAQPARLTLPEALALRLAIARLAIPEESELYEASIDLLEALDHLVTGENMASLEGRIEAPQFEEMDTRLTTIDQAQRERRPVDIDYYSASTDRISTRRVHPYGHGDKHGNHYLVAHCEQADGQRTFRLDRISSIRAVEDAPHYALPDGFDLHETLAKIGPKPGEAQTVRFRVDAANARYAREDFSDQRIDDAAAGDVVVELSAGSLPWAASKVLLYGEQAEMLEPREAREVVQDRLRAFLDQPE